MKVAINKDYGGFGLSDAAVERCVQLGMTLTTYDDEGGYVNPNANFVDRGSPQVGGKYHEIDKYEKEFRTNPIVIKVIEEMGEEANGFCSHLAVIDIPFESVDGWYIDEYDGYETIREEHRSWNA